MFIKESLSHDSNNNFTFKNKMVNLIIIVFLIIPALGIGLLTIQEDSIADQTVPAQTITSDVTWNTDNYIVEGDITIASNGNLTIQQGSNVLYKGNYTIYVEGILFINGTSASPVRLVPNIADPAPGFWGGIRINNTGSGSIVFSEIHYATYGLYLDQVQNYSIKSTEIHYSSISGLVCDGTNNTEITNNSFSENNKVGLHLISAENTTIKYNTINANQIGINVSGSRNNLIGNNSISNRLRNTYDDDTSLTNNWVSNYYGDYMGVDTDNDFIGDFMNYGMSPGFNQDLFPKTKIFNDVPTDLNTYASLTKAIEGSHDVILSGQGSDLVTLDGNYGTCIEVNGNYKLLMNGFKIANSKKGLNLRNGANNCSISNSVMENNEIGALLENTRDITIRKCNFNNNYGLGSLLVNNSKRTTIINGYFNNSDYGIILTDSNFNLILNSSCILNTYAGLKLNHSSFNMINNSVFDSNLDYGVILENMSEYNSFSNNEYTNNLNGIYLNASSNNHFWRSRIVANSFWGIYFDHQANDNKFLGIGSADFQGSNIAIVMKNNSVNASFINSTVGSANVLPLWIDHNSSIIFLNSVLNENTVAILDSLSTMTMMYYLTVITVNKTNVPIPNASVEVYDNKTELIAAGNTSEVGELPLIPCISYIRNQTLRDYSSNNHILIANEVLRIQI
jgi:parallel beta-helix repeat protein